VQLTCVLSDLVKIAAILDMYRNFFAMLVWPKHGTLPCADLCVYCSLGPPDLHAFCMTGRKRQGARLLGPPRSKLNMILENCSLLRGRKNGPFSTHLHSSSRE
jgi:hypothetical protein